MTDQVFYEKENYVDDEQTRKTAMLIKRAKQVDWVDAVVKAATACNQLFQRRACNLCHVYVDRQIEFEQRQAETTNLDTCDGDQTEVVTPVERLWMQMDKGVEVELYRQFLFDEASVVNHVSEDEERDDDRDGQVQYQHQEHEEQPSLSSSAVSVETAATEHLEEIQLETEQEETKLDDPFVVPGVTSS